MTRMPGRFTEKQGQYLAFIDSYMRETNGWERRADR